MVATLKKKWRLGNKFQYFHHVRHIKVPKISIFIPIAQSWHFRVMAAILKKMAAPKKFSIVPSYWPHQIQHVPAGIISLAIILSEILNVKVQKYEKTTLKGQ